MVILTFQNLTLLSVDEYDTKIFPVESNESAVISLVWAFKLFQIFPVVKS
jgi:hypothetical protein